MQYRGQYLQKSKCTGPLFMCISYVELCCSLRITLKWYLVKELS